MSMPGSVIEDEIAIKILIETMKANQNLKELNASLTSTKSVADQAKVSVSNLGKSAEDGLNKVTPAAKNAERGLLSLNNIARTVFGTFTAMAVFFVTKFAGDAIAKTIDSLTQLELAFYKIGIAERTLSQSGINITPKDLTDISNEVVNTFKTVSQIDALKMVSDLAILTKDLSLTKDQYKELSLIIPALARRTGESIENITGQIVNGLTKNGRGFADLGITVNASIIQQEAVRQGLVASAEAYDNLTAVQKQHIDTLALLSIAYNNVQDEITNQSDYLNSIPGQINELTSSWEDFTTELGKTAKPEVSAGLSLLINIVHALGTGVQILRLTYMGFVGGVVGSVVAIREAFNGNIHSVQEFIQVLKKAGDLGFAAAYQQTAGPSLPKDTPTGQASPAPEGQNNTDAIDKARQEILDAQLKLGQDLIDAKIDYQRKLDDIDTEYSNKRADIIKDETDKVKDIQASARADQLKKEQEFQERLLELREKFLMNLEDALHARDARQVLRLINQYNIDKNDLIRKHALEDQQDKAAAAKKIADAKKEAADKLKQLNIAEARERQAALLSYNRKKEDLQRAERDRLAIMAAGLVSQFNLTKDGLNAIANLFMQYFGGGGFIDQIYSAMAQRLSGTAIAAPSLGAVGGAGGTSKGTTSVMHHQAEGGVMIANRPTSVVFGDNNGEPEMAQFTPLGHRGRDVNKLFTDIAGSSGNGEGKLNIEVTLSPDLEGRIIENALNGVANAVTKVTRSK